MRSPPRELPAWLKDRSAGVHLHLSSLPGPCGIGSLGQQAYEWIDFLQEAGFKYWQTCPIGPTGFGDSPYQVFCSSAGNPYFIDWQPLLDLGCIALEELPWEKNPCHERVDFGFLHDFFYEAMRKVYDDFLDCPKKIENRYGSFQRFRKLHGNWLDPFATFQALKLRHSLRPWWLWPESDKKPRSGDFEERDRNEYDFQAFMQYLFRSQWRELQDYALSKDVFLIGDLPIYVAPDSVDVWHNPKLFQIDADGNFSAVAGVPPDYFNETGQLWGNPLYDWPKMRDSDYEWWIERIRDQLDLFSVLRIDHFRAFHDYWRIPRDSADARHGSWSQGPGMDFWKCISNHFPEMPFLAEDLGDLSKGVRVLRQEAGLPGMAVLQFAFDGDPKNLYLPHNLCKDTVLYTGTHDNDTSCGWYQSVDDDIRSFFRSYLNVDGAFPGWEMIRSSYRSVAQLVIIPAQDLLSLGSEGRFNVPGEPHGNWTWRMTSDQFQRLREESTAYLRQQAILSDRMPAHPNSSLLEA